LVGFFCWRSNFLRLYFILKLSLENFFWARLKLLQRSPKFFDAGLPKKTSAKKLPAIKAPSIKASAKKKSRAWCAEAWQCVRRIFRHQAWLVFLSADPLQSNHTAFLVFFWREI
jgi:hypothetical protein